MRSDTSKPTRTHDYEDPTDQGVGSSNLLAHVLKGILIRECLFPFINSIFLRLSVFGKALSGGFQEPVLLR